MFVTRAAAALRRARRTRARLEAWIVREGAGTRRRLAGGLPSSPASASSASEPRAVPVPVPPPGQDAEPEGVPEASEVL